MTDGAAGGAASGATGGAEEGKDTSSDTGANEEEKKDEESKDENQEEEEEKKDEFVDPLNGELALEPARIPFFNHPKDKEPYDPDNKIFKSPVFIVNPKFSNKHCKPEDDQLFHSHYYAGYKQPKKSSKFPIVHPKV